MTLQEYVTQQFVGKEKSKQEVLDDIYKSLKEGWNEKLGYVPEKPMALITVHDPKSSVIESIGFSEPNDLIQNRFGVFFGSILNSGGTVPRSFQDTQGTFRTVNGNHTSDQSYARTNTLPGSTNGGLVRIGRGGAITRDDLDLTDPFIVAPESNLLSVSTSPLWSPGSQNAVIDALMVNVTSSDTIGECGLYLKLTSVSPPAANVYMMSHDVAGASFSSGQNINITYTWSIA